ncbi:extracellular ligand-gated ion channel [Aureococcus anophagefferens]|nr:extracellular ligand-gated ion channel [Aureococcus anophagefferens]
MEARGDGLERFLPAAADAQKTTSQLALPDGEFGGALRSSLSALYEDRGGAELELTVEGSTQGVACHAFVLETWSPVLRAQLSSRWAGGGVSGPRSVEAPGGSRPAVEALVAFCYTGRCSLGLGDLAGLVEKLKIADEFGLARLRQRCARRAKFDELFRAADGDSGKRSSPLLLELAPDMVGEVLCKSRLAVVDEADVLDFVRREYAAVYAASRGDPPAVLAQLLPAVRFPFLGDKLLELRADAELMAVDGAVALVMRALEILAFPQSAKPVSAKEEETADPSTLQTLARTGLCCFDGTFSSSLATIGDRARALSIPRGAPRALRRDAAGPRAAARRGAGRPRARGEQMRELIGVSADSWTFGLWVVAEHDVAPLSPTNNPRANPACSNFAICNFTKARNTTVLQIQGNGRAALAGQQAGPGQQNLEGHEILVGDVYGADLRSLKRPGAPDDAPGDLVVAFSRNGALLGQPVPLSGETTPLPAAAFANAFNDHAAAAATNGDGGAGLFGGRADY